MVIEFRQLTKIENRYARRKHLSPDEVAHWEEVDARLDTLREDLKAHPKWELDKFARAYRKSVRSRSRG
ncbi:hypothetical protein D3C83_140210 [compost metagenome]